jgi:antitoxin YefM
MQAEAYPNVKNNLQSFMKKVNDDADAIMITSVDGKSNSVLLSQDEYNNLVENAYIHGSKDNVEHIMKSWSHLKNGNGKEHDWE